MLYDTQHFMIAHALAVLAFFVPFWLGSYAYAIIFMWRALAPIARTNFHFYITDIWVTILCLMPVLALIAETSKLAYAERERDFIGLGILVVSQILGIVLARIFSIPRAGETMPRRTDQALCIVTGAYLFGVVGLFGVIAAFLVLALMAMMLISCPPLGIWFLASMCLIIHRAWKKPKAT